MAGKVWTPDRANYLGFAVHLKRLKTAHGDAITLLSKIDLTKGIGEQRVAFECKNNHTWKAPFSRVANGHGCPHCAPLQTRKKLQRTLKWYTDQLPDTLRVKPDQEYVNVFTPLLTECLTCGHEWMHRPHSWLHNHPRRGCPKCGMRRKLATGGYSLASMSWMEQLSRRLRLKIQHQENGGEHKIYIEDRAHRYQVDGFNKRNGLVFEFLGDYWHGRGDRRSRKYRETIQRLNALLAAGYPVFVVWESEFRQGELGRLFNPHRPGGKGFAVRASVPHVQTKDVSKWI